MLFRSHGATSIMEYRQMGYLPDALVNFLALMGWAPSGDREILPIKELIKEFTLEKVNKTSAIFNIDKLNWLNGQYLKEKGSKELLDILAPLLVESGIIGEDFDREKLLRLVELYKVRMKTLADFVGYVKVFYNDKIDRDPEAVKKHLENEKSKTNLIEWRRRLAKTASFDKDSIEENCRSTAAELHIKPAELIHPARVAISGTTAGAGLFEMMEILGKETVFRRIDEATGTS